MSDEMSSPRAGEYVLGTLPLAERIQFESELIRDSSLRSEVQAWQNCLAPLAKLVPSEAPPADLWAAIEQKLVPQGKQATADTFWRVERLRRTIRLWRGATALAGSLAAVLATALVVVLSRSNPTPDYLAVVDRAGETPAFIVRVDLNRSSVLVRSLAEAPADRSLELWYVGKDHKPVSLGVISRADQVRRLPSLVSRNGFGNGEIAISSEPKGGSPTGVPTGPVVYSGRLIKIRT